MTDTSRQAEPSDPNVAAALREYLERLDRGELVDREEFLARHAPIADQLRSFIAAEDDVRKLAAAATPLDRAHESTKSFVGHGLETVMPQSVGKRVTEIGGSGLVGQFGRYRIIRALGKGAMGTVYLAEDTQLERRIALKTPHFTEDPTGEQMERFFREARAAGNLRHPNICPIHDFGQIDGKHYISMAYIEGRTLSAFIQPDKPQTERQILIVVRKLALALQEAHDHGIVHRDLKPANIMVDKKGEPIIMDFGLAQHERRNDDIRLTQTGNILGTPAFMSPEQVEGEPDKIGASTDQYSLGVILYELLTGQLPFRGSVIAVMGQILTAEPLRPSQLRSEMDQRVEAVCLKMMTKNPSQRFESLKAVADELAAILRSPASKATSEKQPVSSAPTSLVGDRIRADVGASQVLKSLKRKAVTESDLASLEELARKCYSRRDFEQVIQIIERIPDAKRNAGLVALLEKSRDKTDEIAFLICEIDEADRLNDGRTALKKAEGLLKIKPGHHRALKVQEKYSGYGEGGSARIGILDQFRRPLNDGGWIPWSVLAFGLAVFGVMTGVMVIYLGRTAVVIDVQDPGVEVAVKGTALTITGPDQQSVKVVPGDQELTITCAGLETTTRRFSLKKGDKKTVTVSIINSQLVARLENEILPPTPGHEEQPSPTASGKTPLLPPTSAHEAQATAALPPTFTNGLGMEFVLVPKGKSWLGGGGGKVGDKEVVIAHDFYLGKYEVTEEEWEKVTGLTPSFFSRTGGHHDRVKDIADAELKRFPVENVKWEDAQAFLKRLNETEHDPGWVYRLPKEAEWEYACRGGPLSDKSESAYDFYFDKPTSQLFPEQANFGHQLENGRTCKVGSYKPNRLGLYDMHGNVVEWCDDVEKTGDGASRHVIRGGSWGYGSGNCQAALRIVLPPAFWASDTGLRVARVPVRQLRESSLAHTAKPADTMKVQPNSPQLLVSPFGEVAAKESQKSWAAHIGSAVELSNAIGMQMTLVPPGRFEMGSPETVDQLRQAFPATALILNEIQQPRGQRPVHSVTISKPYYLGKYEVTKGQFRQFVDDVGYRTDAEKDGKGSSGFKGGQERPSWDRGSNYTWRDWGVEQPDDAPVVNVSHYDAMAFCAWLSKKEGKQYRLPTEAEWEYACRAGTLGRYYSGDDPEGLTKIGNVADAAMKAKFPGVKKGATVESSDGYAFPGPVGRFRPNNFGLYDMIGNAWEWCGDWYGEDYYLNSPAFDPEGPREGRDRVDRGGAWTANPLVCRAAHRASWAPTDRSCNLGFRVACNVGPGPNGPDEPATSKASDTGFRVARVPISQEPVAQSAPRAGFVPLFNGRDPTGWQTSPGRPGRWRVENGILKGSGPTASNLFTERKDFKDFELHVEARVNDGGNSGVFFRAPSEEWPLGYEAQINSTDKDPNKTGSLYKIPGGIVVGVSPSPVGPDEWFQMDVIAIGHQITIKVNGDVTATYPDPESDFAAGHIGLQQQNPQTVVEFRKIEIKELPPEASPGPPAGEKSSKSMKDGETLALFDGRTFTGWKTLGYDKVHGWKVTNGEIVTVPIGKTGPLLVTEDSFDDFEFQCDFWLDKKGNSGVYLRGRYEVQLLDDPNWPGVGPKQRCGSIWGRLAPSTPAYVGPRRWNHLLARLERKTVTIVMNGRTTIENQLILGGPTSPRAVDDLEDQPGPIALSNEGTVVRFRNLQIRRLKSTSR